MSAQAGAQPKGHSTGLVLAILVDRNELSMRELVLCFVSCKALRELLDGRGFCIGTAWLCASLESGRSPTEILSRLRSARGWCVAYDHPLSRVDQVTSFLTRHENYDVRWRWAWAQLLYQEPDGGVLCEGVKKMHWMLERRLIQELHKSTEYHPGLCTFKGDTDRSSTAAWSPDGKLVASGSFGLDSAVKIWDVATGKEAAALLTRRTGFVNSVGWSPDGKRVASGSHDSDVMIWDVATSSEAMLLTRLTGHSGGVFSVAWSPDGKLVASGSHDRTLRIWNVATGKEVVAIRTGHLFLAYSVAWSPDGKQVASCEDNQIKIWDVATGKETMAPLTGHSNHVIAVAWSPNGKLVASGSDDMTVRIWDVATGKEAMAPLTGHSGFVRSVAFSPDGNTVASGSYDNTVRLWDVEMGKEKCSLKGHSKDNPECTCYKHGFFQSWVRKNCKVVDPLLKCTLTGNLKCTLTGHLGNVSSVAWSLDGKLVASGSWDGTVRIWDIATAKKAMPPLKGSFESWVDVGPEVRALAERVRKASEDRKVSCGGHIVTAEDDAVVIYSAARGGNTSGGNQGRRKKSNVSQGTSMEAVALFRCPSHVHAVACRPPYICAGCVGGQVLLLHAPILCEGPGICR